MLMSLVFQTFTAAVLWLVGNEHNYGQLIGGEIAFWDAESSVA